MNLGDGDANIAYTAPAAYGGIFHTISDDHPAIVYQVDSSIGGKFMTNAVRIARNDGGAPGRARSSVWSGAVCGAEDCAGQVYRIAIGAAASRGRMFGISAGYDRKPAPNAPRSG